MAEKIKINENEKAKAEKSEKTLLDNPVINSYKRAKASKKAVCESGVYICFSCTLNIATNAATNTILYIVRCAQAEKKEKKNCIFWHYMCAYLYTYIHIYSHMFHCNCYHVTVITQI